MTVTPALMADSADTTIYSTPTPAPHSADAAGTSVRARIAAILERDARPIIAAWMRALRSTSAFYDAVTDDELAQVLEPMRAAYQGYFEHGDPAPFIALVSESVRRRLALGFPLVEMEKNVGAVRRAAVPFVLPALVGDAAEMAAAMDAMMTIEELCVVEIAEAYQALTMESLHSAQEAALISEREKVSFCREMARFATHGKLIICDHEDIPPHPGADGLDITTPRDVRAARRMAAELTRGWGADRSYSLQLCIGEAGSNALRHADSATFEIWADEEEVTVRLADAGPGIDFCRIPEAIRSGFSTGSTLGMGFTVMLDAADRVCLATDHHGTTLQISFLQGG